jgi:transcriptional regulator with XRE-family HTH domain
MGRGVRRQPERLAEKLFQIRTILGLSQNEMIARLGLRDELTQEYISGFERGVREPSLPVLLEYARVAGVWMDVLVDDGVDLPETLPSPAKHEGIRSKTSKRVQRR